MKEGIVPPFEWPKYGLERKGGMDRIERLISLDEIHIPEETVGRILRKDWAQIECMRRAYEFDHPMVRVVLMHHPDGGYNVEDGRHRVIAAKLAEVGFIFAVVIGEEKPIFIIVFYLSDPSWIAFSMNKKAKSFKI